MYEDDAKGNARCIKRMMRMMRMVMRSGKKEERIVGTWGGVKYLNQWKCKVNDTLELRGGWDFWVMVCIPIRGGAGPSRLGVLGVAGDWAGFSYFFATPPFCAP